MDQNKPPFQPTRQTILVVDDEPHVCELIAEALSHLGHQVQIARDGKDALEKLEVGIYSIVITDLDMPRMDGMELIKHLCQDSLDIDTIAITGHSMKYKYTDVVAAGAADFITKPFTLNELEAKLNRIIRERYLRQELEHLVVRDPLTGLYNRRFFDKVVQREAVRSLRYQHPLFLLFLDIDSFKLYNDQHGHQAGDNLLIMFAEVLRSSIREHVDTAFRFGGDEFTVLLPHLTKEQASVVAERIRDKYNSLQFKPTTLSIGAAQFRIGEGGLEQGIKDIIFRADNALFHAKRQLNGNKVHFDES